MAKPEIDYKAREEHVTRLRKIVLHSADVMPERVAKYMCAAVEDGRRRARTQILKTFVPLVDHIPATFVDFALGELIEKPDEADWNSFHDMSELGIGGVLDYNPPAHVQGPFLRLLRTHEEEGLRLVHGLTNAATDYWCRRETNVHFLGYSRTPLPVVLPLPSGPKDLWGNEDVYCWFRHTSVGPYAVISALMALEVWMEEQVASGRDAGLLIDKVVAGTRSVAVLGVCVAVALGTPGHCLPAVLPYFAHPIVWRMDIRRRQKDLQGSPIFDFSGKDKHINEYLRDRNGRPQRGLEVRNLISLAVIHGDDATRAALNRAFAIFGDELPFQYEEERGREELVQALRAEVEDYRALLKRDNYQEVNTKTATAWRYQPPRKPSLEEHSKFEQALEFQEYLGLANWALTTLDSNAEPDTSTMGRIVAAAVSYTRDDDFSKSPDPDPTGESNPPDSSTTTSIYSPDWTLNTETDPLREQALAAVAAAVAVKGWAWAKEHGYGGWCRAVLLAAARCPRSRFDALNRRNAFHLDYRLLAARGLTGLVAEGAADAKVRLAVLELVLDQQLQVVGAVFTGLRPAWELDEVLCWNGLWLALSFATVPGGTIVPGMGLAFNEAGVARLERLWQQCTGNLQRGEKSTFPAIEVDERGFVLWDLVGRVLQSLPVEDLLKKSETRRALLGLADGLLSWTLNENQRRGDEDHRSRQDSDIPHEWNDLFLGWLANLARYLAPDEAERHVYAPVLATWPKLPRLVADLLHGLLQYQVARLPPQEPPALRAIQAWERVCNDLLGRPELARWADKEYLSSDWSEVATTMIFVEHGMYFLKDEWVHVKAFTGVIEKWIDVLGTNHVAYQAFLTMLRVASRHFPPAQVVSWLHRLAFQSKDLPGLWGNRNNGEMTARVLHIVWQASRQELAKDRIDFQKFSELVDRLAVNGVTLASVIQQELEGMNAG